MNNYSSTKILVTLMTGILVLGIISCTSSKKSSSKKGNSDAMGKDSTDLNNSGIIEQDALPPGTAKVLFLEVTFTNKDERKLIWESTVNEVVAYGPSTPSLGIGDRLEVDATGYFMNQDLNPEYYAQKDSIICLISHKQRPEVESNTSPTPWELIDILNY